jgi:hypothetical protein
MTEREGVIRQIKEIAQKLKNENELDFDIFRLAHPYCTTIEETRLKTRIVKSGTSEGHISKRLACNEHKVSSKWVRIN